MTKVERCPHASIAAPASVGPQKLEIEKPSASQPKLVLRACASLPWPIACCTEMWKSMKPLPAPAAATYSVAIAGKRAGSDTEAAKVPTAMIIGQRTPTRSTSRPPATPNAIGSAARIDMITPTLSAEAPIDSACRDIVSRLPLNAACVSAVATTMSRSGMRDGGAGGARNASSVATSSAMRPVADSGADNPLQAAPRLEGGNALLDGRVAREKRHESVALGDAECLQRLRQRSRLEAPQAAQRADHGPGAAEERRAAGVRAELALAREPGDH